MRAAAERGLYGLDNFYYRRSNNSIYHVKSLYGLDNFYYRRCRPSRSSNLVRLYGLDNFYYRRSLSTSSLNIVEVYTDLIISTIVDVEVLSKDKKMSIRT